MRLDDDAIDVDDDDDADDDVLPVRALPASFTASLTPTPRVAITGLRSIESSTSPIMVTRFASLASSNTLAVTFWISRFTREIDTLTPALKDSKFRTSASKLTFAERFDTAMSISPTWRLAFRKTSGAGTVTEELVVTVSSVSYMAESLSPVSPSV